MKQPRAILSLFLILCHHKHFIEEQEVSWMSTAAITRNSSLVDRWRLAFFDWFEQRCFFRLHQGFFLHF
ncbi:MAG: hypothetical protein EDM79_09820 [Chloroflexi bacterium]|nr:MAG: hypothetical protein EDM79_09820 [Chloroflexota bacterium]